jgi:pyridoxine 5'-phosphate synthase PdxJ
MSVETATHSKARVTIGALLSVVLGIAVVAGVGLTLHKVSADPQPKLKATNVGTIVAAEFIPIQLTPKLMEIVRHAMVVIRAGLRMGRTPTWYFPPTRISP